MGVKKIQKMPARPTKKTVGIFQGGEKLFLLQQLAGGNFDFVLAESRNGERFTYLPSPLAVFQKRKKIALTGISGFRGSSVRKETLISWVGRDRGLIVATMKKGTEWHIENIYVDLNQPTIFIESDAKKNKDATIYALSGGGKGTLSLYRLGKKPGSLIEIGPVLRSRKGVEYGVLSPLFAEWTNRGLLVVYTAKNGWGFPLVGGAIIDIEHLGHEVWRSPDALWEAPLSATALAPHIVGCASLGKNILLYLERTDGSLETLALPRAWEWSPKKKKKVLGIPGGIPQHIVVELVRFSGNPILEPIAEHPWESFATFNPAAIEANGRIHLLYRAQGPEGLSVLGYAASDDGFNFFDRPKIPAYVPREPFEAGLGQVKHEDISLGYVSGGGYGGCEDPKMTLIDDRVYLTYVAFDGWHPPRIALSWIPFADFLDRRWQAWSRPVLISPPGVVDKSAAILPEKINGKYVIFHRIFPNILIDFVDDLESFDGRTFLRGEYAIPPRSGFWDGGKLSVGAPPIKTDRGWLVIYHATSVLAEHANKDARYKMGAMLLDLEDPTKVLVRSADAILEPETHYENEGHKFGIVYPCGAVIRDDTLFVYYGASDKTVAVATAPLNDFLDRLIQHKTLYLKPLRH